MIIDATFWVSVSFFIFIGGLVYLKVPSKIITLLNEKIYEIKKELTEAEKLKEEANNLFIESENKFNKANKESIEIINNAKKNGEKLIIENTEKFYKITEIRKKSAEEKIKQLKNQALKDVKNASIKITIESVKNILKNSIDKEKLDLIYKENLDKAKTALYKIKT